MPWVLELSLFYYWSWIVNSSLNYELCFRNLVWWHGMINYFNWQFLRVYIKKKNLRFHCLKIVALKIANKYKVCKKYLELDKRLYSHLHLWRSGQYKKHIYAEQLKAFTVGIILPYFRNQQCRGLYMSLLSISLL